MLSLLSVVGAEPCIDQDALALESVYKSDASIQKGRSGWRYLALPFSSLGNLALGNLAMKRDGHE